MKPKSIKFVRMTHHEANQSLLLQLKKIYDAGEASYIADLVMENVTGKSRHGSAFNRDEVLPAEKVTQIEKYTEELLSTKPVQYVLHEAWFAGMKFYVDENVLIPRPETEELVEWVYEEATGWDRKELSILDVGTGSGCIPVALRKKIPRADIYAIDISDGALSVAKKNAGSNDADIAFFNIDIFDEPRWNELPEFDIIVSNPPYVPEKDKESMHDNVLKFEPYIALFVPNNDPLIFYKTIARFAEEKLKESGKMFFEIHQDYGEHLQRLFLTSEFQNSALKKDINANNRFLYLSK